MASNEQKGQLMSPSRPSLPALDEIRQANALFLHFLRSRPVLATGHFGLSQRVADLLCGARPGQIDQAADFPRALFRLQVPEEMPAASQHALMLADDGGRHVLQATLFLSAWNITRMSGYAARMLLRLDDADIDRFRHAEMRSILQMSMGDHVLFAAFDDLEWIWQQLLTESRPECRQQLTLLGLQPGLALAVN